MQHVRRIDAGIGVKVLPEPGQVILLAHVRGRHLGCLLVSDQVRDELARVAGAPGRFLLAGDEIG